jgi:hypothetical protein
MNIRTNFISFTTLLKCSLINENRQSVICTKTCSNNVTNEFTFKDFYR